MRDDRIDPFWEFYYETGIDPTGGELDTGDEDSSDEVIEDEDEYVEESCCQQVHGLVNHHHALADAEACAVIASKTLSLAELW